MKRLFGIITALAILTTPAWAVTKTVTLSVPGMTCAACPITVKQALTKVSGVTKVEVDLKKLQAVVSYDDAKTTVAALTRATANAGYPSMVK
jgi:mercuric ion binding protein